MALSRDDLIRELSQNFATEEESEKEKKRYHEDTITLMSHAQKSRMDEIASEQRKSQRKEIALELEEYADLILGKIQFMVLKDDNLAEGDTLVFREFKDFKATGNMNIKTITYLQKDKTGISQGYCVVAWN